MHVGVFVIVKVWVGGEPVMVAVGVHSVEASSISIAENLALSFVEVVVISITVFVTLTSNV